jgi:hypothetical protein
MTVKEDLNNKLRDFKGVPEYIILSEANYYELTAEGSIDTYAAMSIAVIPNSVDDIVEVR